MWIEHLEVDDSDVDDMFKPVFRAGLPFGAARWVAALDRHCERLSCLATNVTNTRIGNLHLFLLPNP